MSSKSTSNKRQILAKYDVKYDGADRTCSSTVSDVTDVDVTNSKEDDAYDDCVDEMTQDNWYFAASDARSSFYGSASVTTIYATSSTTSAAKRVKVCAALLYHKKDTAARFSIDVPKILSICS